MKFLPGFAIILSLILCAQASEFEQRIKEIIDRAVDLCEEKEHVSDDDLENAKGYSIEQWNEAYDVKCFSDCFLEEVGLVSWNIF